MEYRIVKKASSDKPYREPEFDRVSKILECMDKENPVREVHLQANHRFYEEGRIERLSAPARLIYLVQKFDLEMVNGGIHVSVR